jgi:RNA-binding protein
VSLSPAERRALRARAHGLKPVVTVGAAGLSEGVFAELHRALDDHELVKVRLPGASREERAELARALGEGTSAELVQTIGRIAVLYRALPPEGSGGVSG